jgi:protein-S-isoprenylcysteine O-methyltransferase Ste14
MLLFLISGPLSLHTIYLFIVELCALALIVWAVILMVKKSKFSDQPGPAQNAHLLETGPYKYIRNPIYSGTLLAFGVLLLDHFTILQFTIFVLLTIVLLKKISIEEKLLTQKFKSYSDYKSRTRRLIPFLY